MILACAGCCEKRWSEWSSWELSYELLCEQVAENRRQVRYTPKVEVHIPRRPTIQLDGTVIYTRRSQVEINLALNNAFRDPVTVQGNVGRNSCILFNWFEFLCSLWLNFFLWELWLE